MTMRAEILSDAAGLRAAHLALDEGRIADCLGALAALPPIHRQSLLSEVLGAVARAVQDGNWRPAQDLAAANGFPCLAGVLRSAARHFLETGDDVAAYECLGQLECVRPGSWQSLAVDASAAFRRRYAAWHRANADELGHLFGEWGDDAASFVAWSLQSLHARPPAGTVGTPLQQAYVALQEGRWRDVEGLARMSTRDTPVHQVLALMADAHANLARGDVASAETSLERACELGVPLPWLHLQCCRVLSWGRHTGLLYEALTLLEQVDAATAHPYYWSVPFDVQVRFAGTLLFTMMRAPSPHIYSLQRAKREMVVRWGAAAAAMVHAELSWQGRPWQWGIYRLEGVEAHEARHSLASHVFAQPKPVRLVPPRLFGIPSAEPMSGTTRRLAVTFVPEARIASKSNLAFTDDVALMDASDAERARVPYNPDVNPPVISFSGDELFVIAPAAPDLHVARALSLTGNHTENFGHWIQEFMLQVIACARLPGFDRVTVVVDAQMPGQHRELLQMLLPPGHPVVVLQPGQVLACDELWSCSRVAYWPGGETFPIVNFPEFHLSDGEVIARLFQQAREKLRAPARGKSAKRLYLTRRSAVQSFRPLHDRAGVEDWFAAHGFEVMDFGGLSIAEQMRHVRAAATIVLEGGSARYAAMFAEPGTRVGELSDDWWAEHEWNANAFAALGLDYLILPCARNAAREITVDTAQLGAYVDALERGDMQKEKDSTPAWQAVKADLAQALGEISRLRSTCDALTAQLAQLSAEVQMTRAEVDITRSKEDVPPALLDAFWQYRTTEEYARIYTERHPLVTVCMSTYNRPDLLLERSLPSVLSQDYPNLEVVVVGDGCTDETVQRMQAIRDPRVRFVNRPRTRELPIDPLARWKVAGTDAVNHAFELARGVLVTHLDDDDEYLPGRIGKLVEHLQATRAEFVFHPFYSQPVRGPWTVNRADSFRHGAVTTGSVLGIAWLKRLQLNALAYLYHEPDDWNRFRRILYLGARIERHPDVLLRHYVEGKPGQAETNSAPHPDELNLAKVVVEGFQVPPYLVQGLWPDGWVGEDFSLTAVPPQDAMALQFVVEVPGQFDSGLQLSITSGGHRATVELPKGAMRPVVVPLRAQANEPVRVQVHANKAWCPKESIGAPDDRRLAYRLLELRLTAAS